MLAILIQNGTVVNANSTTRADVLIEAGVIKEFGLDGCPMLFELVGKKSRDFSQSSPTHGVADD